LSSRQASGRAEIRLIEASFPEDGYLDTGVSAALLRQVSRAEGGAAIRLHRTGPILAFGRLDRLRPGYRRAIELARAHGYEPVERLAGGRAAVFHEGTISFSQVVPAADSSGAYRGTRERFAAMAETMVAALSELSIDARIGEVSGEYCPGEFSVNARGESKLAGIGQRVLTGGAHVGGVVVVRGAGRIRTVLEPIYEALELDWRPATTGSIALEIGDDDETIPSDRTDPLIERTMAALHTTLSRTYVLADATLDEATLALAKELADTYRPRLNRDP
jgi:lipoate-protein ligase A